MSGPFEPSAGYGPAVSSGISPDGRSPDAAAAVLSAVEEAALLDPSVEQATSASEPTPAAPTPRKTRRLMRVLTSKLTPWTLGMVAPVESM